MAKKGNGISLARVESDWQTQRDLDTMVEAEAIENDPKRLKAVQALAKRKTLEFAGIASEGPKD